MQADTTEKHPKAGDSRRRHVRNLLLILLGAVVAWVVVDVLHLDYSSRYSSGFTATGIWAFGVTAVEIGALCLPSAAHRLKKLLILLLIYVGSYVCLSSYGGYYFCQTGSLRYSSGLSVSDVSMWQPRFLYWQRLQNVSGESTSQGTVLGYYYCPLIMIDRRWVHCTRRLEVDLAGMRWAE